MLGPMLCLLYCMLLEACCACCAACCWQRASPSEPGTKAKPQSLEPPSEQVP